MYFTTYIEDKVERVGILNDEKSKVLDLSKITVFQEFDQLLNLIEGWNHELREVAKEVIDNKKLWQEQGTDIYKVKVIAPIPRLKRNVICLGLNYKAHVAESQSALSAGIKMPEFPVYFTKMSTQAIGPQEAINSHPQITQEVDYEVELAVIIGKGGTNIPPEEVQDHIFGYTILNDVSARDLQRRHNQWVKGKSLDTFTVMGPWIMEKETISLPVELDLYSKVNGEIRQHSNTKDFIFDIPTVISELSKGLTLEAGDVIATGTPAGVGMGFNPPKYLKAGDVVECYIEKIGRLSNPII
ncbi:5-carboxymethyl-2-hydroxymuconate Delta-isomerase [Alkaliphilus metalliredigens QYMF]|uniref:5-carboxymethyl-2-hydroxymuconate Delta-isomerase n=1 Tax=Alkaliphilus metalliredigens (strain QYMF) TaxID=293826 RepID=A6TL34_ALKMQ|nr:fumarylacetoacetate hydrolase family protein [Alkaliphilus metalliredigens]ABR46902.1 5-carboxymethyl-2-hydroxymuconate Delta-isomerase [Alkaliphilus metalliredigens QYMF]